MRGPGGVQANTRSTHLCEGRHATYLPNFTNESASAANCSAPWFQKKCLARLNSNLCHVQQFVGIGSHKTRPCSPNYFIQSLAAKHATVATTCRSFSALSQSIRSGFSRSNGRCGRLLQVMFHINMMQIGA